MLLAALFKQVVRALSCRFWRNSPRTFHPFGASGLHGFDLVTPQAREFGPTGRSESSDKLLAALRAVSNLGHTLLPFSVPNAGPNSQFLSLGEKTGGHTGSHRLIMGLLARAVLLLPPRHDGQNTCAAAQKSRPMSSPARKNIFLSERTKL